MQLASKERLHTIQPSTMTSTSYAIYDTSNTDDDPADYGLYAKPAAASSTLVQESSFLGIPAPPASTQLHSRSPNHGRGPAPSRWRRSHARLRAVSRHPPWHNHALERSVSCPRILPACPHFSGLCCCVGRRGQLWGRSHHVARALVWTGVQG